MAVCLGCAVTAAGPARAAGVNEIHLQYGNLRNITAAGGGSTETFIITWQHASEWRYGNSFFFVDQINRGDGSDIYTEAYTGLSLGKIAGRKIGIGPLRDTGPRIGINWGADTNVRRYLPGWRFAWSVPGFRFFNIDFYGFFDDSKGVRSGGVPKQSDSWQADWNFQFPVSIGRADFSFEGHFEYTGKRRNEFGQPLARAVLGQPQFRYDLGKAIFGRPNKLFAGVELLLWLNKQGDPATDEARVQALIAWRL